ncbi:MAG: hypothetical protein M3252_03000 [Actinomycetota bacterium]|nr:hypothetical protein [Actinomycetota bacterium]
MNERRGSRGKRPTISERELAKARAVEAADDVALDRATEAVTLCASCRQPIDRDAVITPQGPVHQECLDEAWGE